MPHGNQFFAFERAGDQVSRDANVAIELDVHDGQGWRCIFRQDRISEAENGYVFGDPKAKVAKALKDSQREFVVVADNGRWIRIISKIGFDGPTGCIGSALKGLCIHPEDRPRVITSFALVMKRPFFKTFGDSAVSDVVESKQH